MVVKGGLTVSSETTECKTGAVEVRIECFQECILPSFSNFKIKQEIIKNEEQQIEISDINLQNIDNFNFVCTEEVNDRKDLEDLKIFKTENENKEICCNIFNVDNNFEEYSDSGNLGEEVNTFEGTMISNQYNDGNMVFKGKKDNAIESVENQITEICCHTFNVVENVPEHFDNRNLGERINTSEDTLKQTEYNDENVKFEREKANKNKSLEIHTKDISCDMLNVDVSEYSDNRNLGERKNIEEERTLPPGLPHEDHMLKQQVNDTIYKCKICSYQSIAKTHLDIHISSIHDNLFINIQRINCQISDKLLRSQSILDNHLLEKHKCKIKRKSNIFSYQDKVKCCLSKSINSTDKHTSRVNCECCSKTCHSKQSLGNHLLTKHKTKINCEFCTKSCFSKQALNNHMLKKHKTKINCEFCSKSCRSKQSLDNHILRRHRKQIKCKGNRYSYMLHRLGNIINSKDEHKPQINCEFCHKSFTSKKILESHMSKQHKNKIKNDMIDYITHKIHTCKVCSFQTTFKYHLDLHFNFKHNLHNKQKVNDHCQFCDKSFTKRLLLANHMLKYHKNEILKSNSKNLITSTTNYQDSYKTVKKYSLKEDNNSTDEHNTNLICQFCGKSFTRKQSLHEHLLKQHENEVKNDMDRYITGKIHACNICNFITAMKSNLNRHIESCHNENRTTFNCQFCDRSFAWKRSLEDHLLKHHKDKITLKIACVSKDI